MTYLILMVRSLSWRWASWSRFSDSWTWVWTTCVLIRRYWISLSTGFFDFSSFAISDLFYTENVSKMSWIIVVETTKTVKTLRLPRDHYTVMEKLFFCQLTLMFDWVFFVACEFKVPARRPFVTFLFSATPALSLAFQVFPKVLEQNVR